MAVNAQTVHSIDAVFVGLELLRNEAEIAACNAETDAEVTPQLFLAPDQVQVTPLMGRQLQVPKDRLILETASHRTRVVRQYPTAIDDIVSVARLTSQAVSSTDLQGSVPTAFGFNIEMVYDQDSEAPAFEYLGRRLFLPMGDFHEEWVLAGGAGKIIFQEEHRRWTFTIEPRLNSPDTTKVFLSANLHYSEQRLPDQSEIEDVMREVWTRTHSMIEFIDGRANG